MVRHARRDDPCQPCHEPSCRTGRAMSIKYGVPIIPVAEPDTTSILPTISLPPTTATCRFNDHLHCAPRAASTAVRSRRRHLPDSINTSKISVVRWQQHRHSRGDQRAIITRPERQRRVDSARSKTSSCWFETISKPAIEDRDGRQDEGKNYTRDNKFDEHEEQPHPEVARYAMPQRRNDCRQYADHHGCQQR
jgi:hypothetical protein